LSRKVSLAVLELTHFCFTEPELEAAAGATANIERTIVDAAKSIGSFREVVISKTVAAYNPESSSKAVKYAL
jgi:hypothetical protein